MEVSGKLLVPKCVIGAEFMAVPAVHPCHCHTSHLANRSRRIPSKSFPSATFIPRFFCCCLGHGQKDRGVFMSTRPDPERCSAVEIAIRIRPRLRVVVDLYLRKRSACFHRLGPCSYFRGGRKPGALRIGKTTNPKIFFKNDQNTLRKIIDDDICRNLPLEICNI